MDVRFYGCESKTKKLHSPPSVFVIEMGGGEGKSLRFPKHKGVRHESMSCV